jgi:hypothetical protein
VRPSTKSFAVSPSPGKRNDELHEIAIQIYIFKNVPGPAIFQPVWVEILNQSKLESHHWCNAYVMTKAIEEFLENTDNVSQVNKKVRVVKACHPYGDMYCKQLKGGARSYQVGLVYLLPKHLDNETTKRAVILHMKQMFLNKTFQTYYHSIHTKQWSNPRKDEELSPQNLCSNSFWMKISDAFDRPKTTPFPALRYKLQYSDAKLVMSEIFEKFDVTDEIAMYRQFYDMEKNLGKEN